MEILGTALASVAIENAEKIGVLAIL